MSLTETTNTKGEKRYYADGKRVSFSNFTQLEIMAKRLECFYSTTSKGGLIRHHKRAVM